MNAARHAVVPHASWLDARKALLAREKEQTRLRDEDWVRHHDRYAQPAAAPATCCGAGAAAHG